MCGFLAEYGPSAISKNEFLDLLSLSKSRGPDSFCYWKSKVGLQFGFNRLAILDTSIKGMQPIQSPSNRFVLMLNGEIYNYRILQKQYKISDNRLRSGSDAEVLIQIIEDHGLGEVLVKLDGMFALILFDQIDNKIYFARDFAGIKPLYYGFHDETLVLASQFNQIFLHPVFKKHLRLRSDVTKEYFGLGYMQAPNTVFHNIFQVQPGEVICFNLNERHISEKKFFYNWKEDGKYFETDLNLPALLNEKFEKIIKLQLQSDVPIACFLSGGIDSPLVTAHAHLQDFNLKAFTLSVEDLSIDESLVAIQYAKHIDVNHKIIKFDESELQQCVAYHFKGIPEPHGDYSSIPTWLICNKVKRNATVLLSGDGGDELFWGYSRFIRSMKYLNWFSYPKFLRKIIMPFQRRFDFSVSKGPELFDTFGEWILHKQLNLFSLDILVPNTHFSKELKQAYNFKSSNPKEALLFLKRNEFYAHMQRVLRKVDLMSMANSVEVRVPFLSKEIISFSNSITPQLGIAHNNPKIILKRALEQFVPVDSINLKKSGFSVPIEQWMKGVLKKDIEEMLLDLPIYGEEFIDVSFLKKLVQDFFSGEKVNAQGIWNIYAWQKWAFENGLINVTF